MSFVFPEKPGKNRAAAAHAATPTFVPPDAERLQRLCNALANTTTNVIGHAQFEFLCPCCHQGIGLGGVVQTSQGEVVEAFCSTCSAGYDEIVAGKPRNPLPINTGGFVPATPKPPVEPSVFNIRRWVGK